MAGKFCSIYLKSHLIWKSSSLIRGISVVTLSTERNLPLSLLHQDGFIWCEPQSVPSCLLLHLQVVEVSGYEGNEDELKMVEYLLASAEVLKTFTINSPWLALEKEVKFCKQVLKFPRGSRTCQIEFKGDFFSSF